MSLLEEQDPHIYNSIRHELERQNNKLELIASENFTSIAVMEAMGSVMTNKYAEGYPGKRYYGGCEYVDVAENSARDRGAGTRLQRCAEAPRICSGQQISTNKWPWCKRLLDK